MQQMLTSPDLARGTDLLSAIVTVTDDGGSSGRLRRDLGVLPPGDVRNCLAALTPSTAFERLLHHRFDSESELGGHPVGNLMLAALTQMMGNFGLAIDELARLLGVCGRVHPATLDDVTLRAELAMGEVVDGETAMVLHPAKIRRVSLAHAARPTPEALRAIVNADVIIVGPGSLYTSVLPNLLVDGVAATLSAVRGVRIYVANLMTQPGETDDLTLEDHVRVIREHTGQDLFDYVLANHTPLTAQQSARYAGDAAPLVPCVNALAGRAATVTADLLDTGSDAVRHDASKLASAVLDLVWRAHTRIAAECLRPLAN
jgi:uncharacterized cofD-like protein